MVRKNDCSKPQVHELVPSHTRKFSIELNVVFSRLSNLADQRLLGSDCHDRVITSDAGHAGSRMLSRILQNSRACKDQLARCYQDMYSAIKYE